MYCCENGLLLKYGSKAMSRGMQACMEVDP